MKHRLAIAILGCLFGFGPAWAQSTGFSLVVNPPVETVIVTAPSWLGDRPQAVIHGFVQQYALASPVSNEIARWKRGICPVTAGLSHKEYSDYVTARIREVAHEAGAPQADPADCHTNIHVFFTDKPQEVMDRIRKEGGAPLLGPRPSQAEREGTVRYAVQAWYSTGTRDIFGTLTSDNEDDTPVGGGGLNDLPRIQVEGSLIHTGLKSELVHIYIIADTSKTGDFQLGAIADYIAVLALSQTQSFEDCKAIPSISNLVSPNCRAELKPTAITDTDMAFLKAVYSMEAGTSLQQQQTYISDQIANALGVK